MCQSEVTCWGCFCNVLNEVYRFLSQVTSGDVEGFFKGFCSIGILQAISSLSCFILALLCWGHKESTCYSPWEGQIIFKRLWHKAPATASWVVAFRSLALKTQLPCLAQWPQTVSCSAGSFGMSLHKCNALPSLCLSVHFSSLDHIFLFQNILEKTISR